MFLLLEYLHSGVMGHSDLDEGGYGLYWGVVPGETQYQHWSWILGQVSHVRGQQQSGKGFGNGLEL